MDTGRKIEERRVVLTAPLCLEGGLANENKVPNIVQRILSLFKNVQMGSDLSRFELPPLFNMPKSQLQCYGECVYCTGEDMLSKCSKAGNAVERIARVAAWYISTNRPMIFGVAPFNPVLGETHHASCGNLNVLLEQVSHHPPVTALHGTDEKQNVEIIWCQSARARFCGTSVEVGIHGKRQLNLLSFGEHYEMNPPKLLLRIFPVPGEEWVGNIRIQCKETGLQADLCYKGHRLLGFGSSSRCVTGRIFDTLSMETICDIEGHWDRTIAMKNVHSGETTVLFNAKDTISSLSSPVLQNPEGLLPTESALVWSEVNQGILARDWEKARQAKRSIEERERRLASERKSRGEPWTPRHFTVSQKKEDEWECIPKQARVPPAPIVVPTFPRS